MFTIQIKSSTPRYVRGPEVEKCIISLNNGKVCSPVDNIINEYLKYSKDLLLPLLTKLFNCIFDTGLFTSVLNNRLLRNERLT